MIIKSGCFNCKSSLDTRNILGELHDFMKGYKTKGMTARCYVDCQKCGFRNILVWELIATR